MLYKTLFKRRTALHHAAEGGSPECLLKLLWAAERLLGSNGYQAYVDEADARGNTALALSCKRGWVGGGWRAGGRVIGGSIYCSCLVLSCLLSAACKLYIRVYPPPHHHFLHQSWMRVPAPQALPLRAAAAGGCGHPAAGQLPRGHRAAPRRLKVSARWSSSFYERQMLWYTC